MVIARYMDPEEKCPDGENLTTLVHGTNSVPSLPLTLLLNSIKELLFLFECLGTKYSVILKFKGEQEH